MSRYSEYRRELIEDHTSLASAEAHESVLKKEIEDEETKVTTRFNLRLSYARAELEATQDHIKDIKRQMAMEESEAF